MAPRGANYFLEVLTLNEKAKIKIGKLLPPIHLKVYRYISVSFAIFTKGNISGPVLKRPILTTPHSTGLSRTVFSNQLCS